MISVNTGYGCVVIAFCPKAEDRLEARRLVCPRLREVSFGGQVIEESLTDRPTGTPLQAARPCTGGMRLAYITIVA